MTLIRDNCLTKAQCTSEKGLKCICLLRFCLIFGIGDLNQCFFNSGQYVALRELYLVIYPQVLWTFM